jgi:hypothetical protein
MREYERMENLSDLSASVLSAEKLSGNVVALGVFYSPLITSQSQKSRLLCALQPQQHGVVFSGETAAWIWGALRNPPAKMEYSVRAERRVSIRAGAPHTKRERQFRAGDVSQIDGFEVTSPLRTVFDLLQTPECATLEVRVACRLLLLSRSNARQVLLEQLDHTPRTPHAKRIRTSLESL